MKRLLYLFFLSYAFCSVIYKCNPSVVHHFEFSQNVHVFGGTNEHSHKDNSTSNAGDHFYFDGTFTLACTTTKINGSYVYRMDMVSLIATSVNDKTKLKQSKNLLNQQSKTVFTVHVSDEGEVSSFNYDPETESTLLKTAKDLASQLQAKKAGSRYELDGPLPHYASYKSIPAKNGVLVVHKKFTERDMKNDPKRRKMYYEYENTIEIDAFGQFYRSHGSENLIFGKRHHGNESHSAPYENYIATGHSAWQNLNRVMGIRRTKTEKIATVTKNNIPTLKNGTLGARKLARKMVKESEKQAVAATLLPRLSKLIKTASDSLSMDALSDLARVVKFYPDALDEIKRHASNLHNKHVFRKISQTIYAIAGDDQALIDSLTDNESTYHGIKSMHFATKPTNVLISYLKKRSLENDPENMAYLALATHAIHDSSIIGIILKKLLNSTSLESKHVHVSALVNAKHALPISILKSLLKKTNLSTELKLRLLDNLVHRKRDDSIMKAIQDILDDVSQNEELVIKIIHIASKRFDMFDENIDSLIKHIAQKHSLYLPSALSAIEPYMEASDASFLSFLQEPEIIQKLRNEFYESTKVSPNYSLYTGSSFMSFYSYDMYNYFKSVVNASRDSFFGKEFKIGSEQMHAYFGGFAYGGYTNCRNITQFGFSIASRFASTLKFGTFNQDLFTLEAFVLKRSSTLPNRIIVKLLGYIIVDKELVSGSWEAQKFSNLVQRDYTWKPRALSLSVGILALQVSGSVTLEAGVDFEGSVSLYKMHAEGRLLPWVKATASFSAGVSFINVLSADAVLSGTFRYSLMGSLTADGNNCNLCAALTHKVDESELKVDASASVFGASIASYPIFAKRFDPYEDVIARKCY